VAPAFQWRIARHVKFISTGLGLWHLGDRYKFGVGGWDLLKIIFLLALFLSSGKKVCLSDLEQQGGHKGER
jgi:hypothetical protein